MATEEECLEFARRLYVIGDSVKNIAKTANRSEKWVADRVREAIPKLISDQGWTVKDVAASIGSSAIPIEMRREAVKIRKSMTLAEAYEVTGVSLASLSRWASGEFGSKTALTMGRLPWARLGAEPTESKDKGDAVARNLRAKDNIKKEHVAASVYGMLTGGIIAEIAQQHGVSETAVYMWRKSAVGKTSSPGYEKRCQAFVAKYAGKHDLDPKDVVVRGNTAGGRSVERKPRKGHPLAFRESIINRFANNGEAIAVLAASADLTEKTIYAWRTQLLGPASGKDFTARARQLAKKFIIEARASDQVNGSEAPASILDTAQLMLTEVMETREVVEPEVEASPLEVLSNTLAKLDAQAEVLGKDRRIIRQEIEIQQLRRQLADRA